MTRFKRGATTALSTCVLVVSAVGVARADIAIGAGAEYFRWKESTSPAVEETGMRWVLDLTWIQSRQPGSSFEYNVKLYAGKVDYEGALLFSNTPLNSDTHYRGVQNELRFVYRMAGGADVHGAFGWDHWRRELSSQQREDFDALYLRAGAGFGSMIQQGLFGSIGVKLPFYVRENAHFDQLFAIPNANLRPRTHVSFYANVGYRFNPNWDVTAYYDSYRFRQSNTTSFGFFQPESKQDQYGLKAQRNF